MCKAGEAGEKLCQCVCCYMGLCVSGRLKLCACGLCCVCDCILGWG